MARMEKELFMKKQIKKLNTFNNRLQQLAKLVDVETKNLIKNEKEVDLNSNDLDNIDVWWGELTNLCEDVITYIVCNGA